MEKKEIETFYPASREEWRRWLQENHRSKQSIWLVCYNMKSTMPTISWSEAVEEALCFGWIDSTRRSLDAETFIQFFTKRKPNGTWSKVNKEKITFLIETQQMTQAGLESIEVAKQNGSWIILDDVEALVIPSDLEKEFDLHLGAKDFFLSLSKSVKKSILYWLVQAKRPETRQNRILEIAALAGLKKKPKQF